jgi:folate-dependent phosphoribosylglycinamide formyltransferase PurN
MKVAILTAEPAEICRIFLARHAANLLDNDVEISLVLLDQNSRKSTDFWQHARKVAGRQAAHSGCSTAMGMLKIATYKLLGPKSHGCDIAPPFGKETTLVRVDTLNSQEACDAIRRSGCNLICLMGTRILTRKTLTAINLPIVNIHCSDPRFMRGSPSVVWETLAGYTSVTLTVHKVVPELDSGDILCEAKHPIEFSGGLGSTVSRTMRSALPVVADLFLQTILSFKTGTLCSLPFDPGPLRVTPKVLETLRAEWICRSKTIKSRLSVLKQGL